MLIRFVSDLALRSEKVGHQRKTNLRTLSAQNLEPAILPEPFQETTSIRADQLFEMIWTACVRVRQKRHKVPCALLKHPELEQGSEQLLFAQLHQGWDVVAVGQHVHLGVSQEHLGKVCVGWITRY